MIDNDLTQVVLPNDLNQRKVITDAIQEMNDHQIQIDAHRTGISEIVKEVSKATGVPSKTLKRWAKWKLKGDKDQEIGIITDEEAAFDILFKPNYN